jgi:two-component system, sensor histidine kinase
LRRDLPGEVDRLLALGGRLQRGVEALRDLHWETRDNAARYRDLLDNQVDVLMRRDEEGRLTFVNRAFCRVFGMVSSAALGQAFLPRVLSGDRPVPLAGGTLRRQRYVQEIETARGARWFEWQEHAVSAGAAGAVEVQCLGRDITEGLRAEVELREARTRAEAATRAKSRFLAAMSHEIRTPMNGILGMAALLADTPLLPDQRTYAQAIEGSARALLALIDEILDFSKIEADKLQLSCAPVVLEDCVQEVVELLAPKAHEKAIDIAWSIDPALPRLLLGDEVRVRQIVTNLVDNAIKFTDSGGVLITVGPAEACTPPAANALTVAIAVRDTGIGIAAESLPALFAEFAQADAAVRRRPGGTGLGLAISRRLSRAMGGDILVETAPGHGSTFTALIRLRPGDASAPAPEPDAGRRLDKHAADAANCRSPRRRFALGASRQTPLSVLLVEDNDVNALLARHVLEKAGCGVRMCHNGREAVDAVGRALTGAEPGYDLILMDARMPVLDGLEATRVIKELYAGHGDRAVPCPPIIAVTASAFDDDRRDCLAAGMDDYLAKPFDAEALLRLIDRWCGLDGTAIDADARRPSAQR